MSINLASKLTIYKTKKLLTYLNRQINVNRPQKDGQPSKIQNIYVFLNIKNNYCNWMISMLKETYSTGCLFICNQEQQSNAKAIIKKCWIKIKILQALFRD
jgi:hypothetical protein